MKIKLLLLSWLYCVSVVSRGADITGYSTTVNNRFSSGFPLAPVENGSGSFVGAGYDWSAIAWSTSTYASSSYKGFALLSPKHFLTAQHYEYTTELTSGLRILDGSGSVQTRSVSSMTNTGYGMELTNRGFTNKDIAVGNLVTPYMDTERPFRMGVLDLHTGSLSTSTTAYEGLTVFLTGRTTSTPDGSPRVGEAVIDAAGYIDPDPLTPAVLPDPNQPVFLTLRTDVQLQVGDSGHPALYGWTNPNGDQELTILGVNSAISGTYNYVSWLAEAGAMAATSDILKQEGYALRVVGPTTSTWEGDTGGATPGIYLVNNWLTSSVVDQHVKFDAATAASRNVNVNADANLRGLYFVSSGAGSDGFDFSGANTLTIGRGGITNYDADRQVFTANLTLGSNQYWDVGAGGVSVANMQTAGYLLEVDGTGTAIFSGDVSGSGGLGLSGDRTEITGTTSYTGTTWVHRGALNVSGDISSSAGVVVELGGRLEGAGVVAGISGGGSIDPGNSPGILTTSSVDPSAGLDFHFEFTSVGGPDYTDAGASIQDVLRITDATPFSSSMDGSNTLNIYLDVLSLSDGDIFRGGFFTDTESDFLSDISSASYQWYLADGGGPVSYNGVTYSIYSGPFSFSVSTVADAADFISGTVNGQVMQFVVVPELSSLALAGILLGVMLLWRKK